MQGLWSEAIGSINGYVAGLPKESKVTLAVFDSVSHDILRESKAGKWKNISAEEVSPRGSTPLYDSAARMLWRALDDNPEKATFVVMTDGEENASRQFNQSAVKNLIAQVESKNWQVIFLGANFEKVGDQAQKVGLQSSKFMNISASNLRGSMADLATYSTAYAATGAAINLSDQDKFKATK
jgi:hypothetical protein